MRTYLIDAQIEVQVASGGIGAAIDHVEKAFTDSFENSHNDAAKFAAENPGDSKAKTPRRLITNFDFDKVVRTDPKLEVE